MDWEIIQVKAEKFAENRRKFAWDDLVDFVKSLGFEENIGYVAITILNHLLAKGIVEIKFNSDTPIYVRKNNQHDKT